MWQMVKNSSNPQQTFNQLVASNPKLNEIVNTINALGDPKTAFYKLAEQRGTDPNSIISMLK